MVYCHSYRKYIANGCMLYAEVMTWIRLLYHFNHLKVRNCVNRIHNKRISLHRICNIELCNARLISITAYTRHGTIYTHYIFK